MRTAGLKKLLCTAFLSLPLSLFAEDPFWEVVRKVPLEFAFVVQDGPRQVTGVCLVDWPAFKLVCDDTVMMYDGKSAATIDTRNKEITLETEPVEIPVGSISFSYDLDAAAKGELVPVSAPYADADGRSTEILFPSFRFHESLPQEIFTPDMEQYPSSQWGVTDLR